MMFQMSLLDAMYMQTNCPCLSDLRRLHDWQKARLARSLERIPPEAASLPEWNDALEYLAKGPPQQTREAARALLITALSVPADGADGAYRPPHFSPRSQNIQTNEEDAST